MGRESRHRRKRKTDSDVDTSGDSKEKKEKGRSSPEKKSRKTEKELRKSLSPKESREESLSIEETNKLRASLGLAPLDTNETKGVEATERIDPSGGKVYTEDGMEFVHKAPEHIGQKKRTEELQEKMQILREKRKLHEKVLKTKGLADSDDEDGGAAAWVAKNRQLEEEKKRAEQRAKLLDDMDAEFGLDSLIEEEIIRKKKATSVKKKLKVSGIGGLIVGHDVDDFSEGRDAVLVLEDKSVLDNSDEILVNPNIMEDKRHAKNVELRKRKDPYRPYDEDVDEYGMSKSHGLLAKYDEELEGTERPMFRLDDSGSANVNKDNQEAEIRKKLLLAGKRLESLETPAYKVASEYYTEEEMVSFRKPKKKGEKKLRKKKTKMLKADDLVPDGELSGAAGEKEVKRIADEDAPNNVEVKMDGNHSIKLEEGELDESTAQKKGWKAAEEGGLVNIQQLNKFVEKDELDGSSDEDDDVIGGVDLSGVVIDDDAEAELSAVLEHTRKLKQQEIGPQVEQVDAALKVQQMLNDHQIKEEPMDEEDYGKKDEGLIIDSTMEYCRNLGEIPTYGLAGNRKDAVDFSELKQEESPKPVQVEYSDDEREVLKKKRKSKSRHGDSESVTTENEEKQAGKGKWLEATATTSAVIDSNSQPSKRNAHKSSSDEDSDQEYRNVLGEEADVTKGVGAMLKLAGQKGYLDGGIEKKVKGPSLKHLENKRFSQIESGRYDIEEKYTKKLERMGTTGTGPIRPFPEKADYKPEIQITYTDHLGREMEMKDAFRVLSWKFHGKGPGKKQIEKRQAKQDKKELMKKMNSMDTPLGTLNKQLRKQELQQTPYIILSGSGRDTGAPLKKD
ncbi:hypothetical protein AB6A40_001038 [Gnathostoma spinigerum]|uniref:U4/U6.U5 tri-snRNP-associated protein 1 n=1 Tax=Gnathostoma spinigerum TaxID=75299 RepID=A0ABD6EAE6_9BILA